MTQSLNLTPKPVNPSLIYKPEPPERKALNLNPQPLGFGVPYFNTFFLMKHYEIEVYSFFSLVT